MQLKIGRSQRAGGVLGNFAIFILDVRMDLTPEEQADVRKYKLGSSVIYNSSDSEKLQAMGRAQLDGSTMGYVRQLGFTALAAMKLNITLDGLVKGIHIECKSLDELPGVKRRYPWNLRRINP